MNFSIRFSLKTRKINIYKRPSRSPRKLKTITDPRSRNFMRKIQISDKELLTSSVRSMRAWMNSWRKRKSTIISEDHQQTLNKAWRIDLAKISLRWKISRESIRNLSWASKEWWRIIKNWRNLLNNTSKEYSIISKLRQPLKRQTQRMPRINLLWRITRRRRRTWSKS